MGQNKLFWGEHILIFNELEKIKIADLSLFLVLLKNDLRVAFNYTGKAIKGNTSKKAEENLDWHRWPINENLSHIQISPALPDRSLLVKPESNLNLLKNCEIKVYARFPVSIKISAVYGNKKDDLIEIPTVRLSNTWFGTFKEGEMCYSLSSGIRTEIEPDNNRPFMAICPFTLKNKADESLEIDRICLRSDYMSLFQSDRQLWTDELSFTYKGKNEISQLNFTGKRPAIAGKSVLVTSPRTPLKKSLYTSSFSTIKDLAGAGLFASK